MTPRTALAIHADSAIEFEPRALRSEATARDLARGYEEGAYNALHAIAHRLGVDAHRFAIEQAPAYVEIRGFLIGDCDVDPRIAIRVAVDVVSRRQRYDFDRDRRGELGWV